MSKRVFDLFGVRTADLEVARSAIEAALRVTLQEHESSFLGVYFQAGDPGHGWFRLQENADQEDREPLEAEFSEYPLLIYVHGASDQESVREALEQIEFVTHLRREHLSSP